jgi:DNA-directed RNA polymerase subunit beta'
MKKIISEVIERYNKAELRFFLDAMKSVGFKYGAKAGLTVAMNDVKTPPSKQQILKNMKLKQKK